MCKTSPANFRQIPLFTLVSPPNLPSCAAWGNDLLPWQILCVVFFFAICYNLCVRGADSDRSTAPKLKGRTFLL